MIVVGDGTRRASRAALERRLELIREIALGSSEPASLERALRRALEKICAMTEWSLGQAWLPRADGTLRWRAAWHADAALSDFVRASKSLRFAPGDGLPGAVWSSGDALWIPELDDAEQFARRAAAAAAGLTAGVAVPVLAEGQPVAVFEFFLFERREEDDWLVEVVSDVAADLGCFVRRTQAEDALRTSGARQLEHHEAQLAESQELAHVGSFEWDLTTKTMSWSSELYRIYGVCPDEFAPSCEAFYERIHPGDVAEVRQAVTRATRDFTPASTLHRIVRPDGEVRELHSRLKGVADEGGACLRVIGTCQDVTERRRQAEKAREAQERFELAFNDAPIGMALIAPDGRILQVNRALCEITGYSHEALLTRFVQDMTHPDDLDADRREVERMLSGAIRSSRTEKRYIHADGHPVRIHLAASLVRDAHGEPRYFIAQVEDISKRRQTEDALRESRERLRALLDNTRAPVYLKDIQGRYLLINAEAAAIARRAPEELIGKTDHELLPADLADRLAANDCLVLECGRPLDFEESIPREDGLHTYLGQRFLLRDERGLPYAIGGIFTDITERVRVEEEKRRLEHELQQAQRLEMLGRLAGGIAHDFNNLMAVILSYAVLLEDELPAATRGIEYAAEIKTAAERTAALTQQLLAFGQGEVVEPEVVDLNTVAREAENLLRRTIGEDLELATDLSPDLWPVEADAGQLQRLLLNLAVNARDAMPYGGSLKVATENVVLDEEEAGRPPRPTNRGRYLCLCVSDTGCGMTKDVAARAFEPFFTTKAPGEGTGLGLATVYGVVRQAGGMIELDSTPGHGTTFRVYLPATERAPGRRATVPAYEAARGGSETILVVEDEVSVRALIARILSQKGYRVIEVPGPEKALRALGEHPRTIDLVLTDVVMPKMSGPELAHRLCLLQPGLKVVFVSGHPDDVVIRHGVGDGGPPLLKKPFTPAGLLRYVAGALPSARPGRSS